MHVPDGFLDPATSAFTLLVGLSVVAVALRRSHHEHGQHTVPLAGLAAAFVFAAQMVNFPVGLGTSGHLLGGALVAVLLGPWTAVLAMTVVLGIQALLFADGGITAIGTNTLLLGVVAVAVGWSVARFTVAVLPDRSGMVSVGAAMGALASVPAAAGVFVLLFAVGGQVGVPFSGLFATMLVWHSVIGIGEAVITFGVVSAVMASRPDLVYLARGRGSQRELLIGEPAAAWSPAGTRVAGTWVSEPATGHSVGPGVATAVPPARTRIWPFLSAASAVTVLVAVGLGALASSSPDGLERVAEQMGFADIALPHEMDGFVLAGYGENGVVPAPLVAVLGLIVVATVVVGLVWAARRRRATLR